MANALKEFWPQIMRHPDKTVDQYKTWMKQLALLKRVRNALPLLTGKVTKTAVQVALERRKRGSSPGLDGVASEVYANVPEIFVARITLAVQKCWSTWTMSADWLISVQRNIPKSQGTDTIDQITPIAMRTGVWNWIATTISVVVEDALRLAVLLAQKRFLKHRRVPHHVIDAKGVSLEATFLSIDFAKAYDSVSHAFFEVGMKILDCRRT